MLIVSFTGLLLGYIGVPCANDATRCLLVLSPAPGEPLEVHAFRGFDKLPSCDEI